MKSSDRRVVWAWLAFAAFFFSMAWKFWEPLTPETIYGAVFIMAPIAALFWADVVPWHIEKRQTRRQASTRARDDNQLHTVDLIHAGSNAAAVGLYMDPQAVAMGGITAIEFAAAVDQLGRAGRQANQLAEWTAGDGTQFVLHRCEFDPAEMVVTEHDEHGRRQRSTTIL